MNKFKMVRPNHSPLDRTCQDLGGWFAGRREGARDKIDLSVALLFWKKFQAPHSFAKAITRSTFNVQPLLWPCNLIAQSPNRTVLVDLWRFSTWHNLTLPAVFHIFHGSQAIRAFAVG
jgi:hypothetical protein